MDFQITKAQPALGKALCPRCGATIYRAISKKNSDKIVTVDGRTGPYNLEQQEDGTVLAVWVGPNGKYAYHYNHDFLCASDEDAEEAADEYS
jgi:hypothetical protein